VPDGWDRWIHTRVAPVIFQSSMGESLSFYNGPDKRRKRCVTSAMEGGVANNGWSLEEVIALLA